MPSSFGYLFLHFVLLYIVYCLITYPSRGSLLGHDQALQNLAANTMLTYPSLFLHAQMISIPLLPGDAIRALNQQILPLATFRKNNHISHALRARHYRH